MAIWPRFYEDGQISEEHPLGGIWRQKDSYNENELINLPTE